VSSKNKFTQCAQEKDVTVLKDIMPLLKLEYGRLDEVSYWEKISLGQGFIPIYPSLSLVKWVKWLRFKTQWAWGS
jgi:hypothetical protein